MPLLTTMVGGSALAVGAALSVYGSGITESSSQQRLEAGANPVTQQIRFGGDSHAANSGFLVFVKGDVVLASNETEGSIAAGGDLVIKAGGYQVAAGSPPPPTVKAADDKGYTYLLVGGGVRWDNPSSQVRVENQGFTKIADTSTYDAFNRDSNNATQPYRIVRKGAKYESQPMIEGRSRDQTLASIGTPVPRDLVDFDAAFAAYRQTATGLAQCENTVTVRNANGDELPRPLNGGQAYLTLDSGTTNVLNLTVAELAGLAEITFRTKPTASTPLVVNVTGGDFDGRMPNTAGIGGSDAPYILWNFATAQQVRVTSGATLEGTIFAPNANVLWQAGQNIEGNVIADRFSHEGPGGSEVHGFPFGTDVSCGPDDESTPPAPTPEPSPTETTPTEEPTPTDAVTPTEEPTPTDAVTPTDDVTPTEQPTPTEDVTPTEEVTPSESPTPTDDVTPTQDVTETVSATGEASPGRVPGSPTTGASGAATVAPPAGVDVPQAFGEASSGSLPETGGPHAWAWIAGIALIVAGAVTIAWERWARRRRPEPEDPAADE